MSEKEEKQAKRLKEFIAWIDQFKENAKQEKRELFFIENAAEILNDVYWTLIDDYIRPLVKDSNEEVNSDGENNVSRFKIISTTELTIIQVQPIKYGDEKIERRLNALFAYWVALNILKSFSSNIKDDTIYFVDHYKEDIPGIAKDELQSIQEDHLMWLELIDPILSTPIISNAQTWRLYNLVMDALQQNVTNG
jgi:hypothetical protein